MWAIFGEFDLELLQDIPWSAALLWLYTFLSSIVLVNLLVAMFAETYNRVLSEAEQEHRYQKAVRVFQHRHAILALPPPFNLPIIAFFALIALKDSLCSLPARARRRAPTRACTRTPSTSTGTATST